MLVATSTKANEEVLQRSRAPYNSCFNGAAPSAFPRDREGEICGTGKSLKLNSGSCYIPKDNVKKPQGEDAHFISQDECTVGVADGVGGWAKCGIDSGEYSRQLMSNSLISVQNQLHQTGSVVDPERILSDAYSKTKAQGSSTACIITLTDQQCLHAVNVGDSGFIIIRKGRTVYRSPVQQHYFNCPYQLGNDKKRDRPTSAKVIKMEVKVGDVIVVGTDGLFDNMFEREIEETVMKAAYEAAIADDGGVPEPREVACRIAELALYNSFDVHSATPFQVESEMAGKKHRGGKIDDITVIVSYVQQADFWQGYSPHKKNQSILGVSGLQVKNGTVTMNKSMGFMKQCAISLFLQLVPKAKTYT
ncbi:Protein phosphatase 2C (PP2C)-like domain [Macleaya cordata]|uniref:Protein phosphatase n=1 Tax=Macleaya cordata TaxID=56857 RepID=A0A200PNL7_MACCD|nr:Protein phosphatase 2C (PP2C)-like domain [Macleaya cordata]